MRLLSLELDSFKNLQQFSVSFGDSFTCVLVGPNGTGKSNVLEALIIIFRDLDLGASPSFSYRLTYTCKGSRVEVDADPSRKSPISILVDGKGLDRRTLSRKGGGLYLPNYVFGYYSGPSNRMETHFETHQKRFADELLSGVDQPLRPLLYARQVHSQFVLLSFFQNEQQDRSILADHLRIEDLDSVLFVLKKPSWANTQRKTSEGTGDARFWGARGVVQGFLERLYSLSLAPLRSQNGDRLYLFLKNKEALNQLAAIYAGQQDFFKALESLYISDLIEDARTNVRIKGNDDSLTFRELSEGEQQLLTVLGLLRFIDDNEGLIFLDEPDTHLNPAWSIDYISMLKSHVKDQSSTQVLMTTHDPLVIGSLESDDVLLMKREQDGKITASHPEEDPRGMGVAGLLTSELYGLRSGLDTVTLKQLDRKRDLVAGDKLTPEEADELTKLNKILGRVDFTMTVRDPLYKPFVKALARIEKEFNLRHPVLSKTQLDNRDDAAYEVARFLMQAAAQEKQ